MVKVRFVVSAVLLGVIALLAMAGCGGGGGSSSPSGGGGGEGESSSAFVKGADAACAKADEQIVTLGTPQQSEVLPYMETTESLIETLAEEVEGLKPSGAAEKAYAAALSESVNVLNQMTNAARNENFDAVREISDQLIELHLGELAEKAELKVCSEVPGANE